MNLKTTSLLLLLFNTLVYTLDIKAQAPSLDESIDELSNTDTLKRLSAIRALSILGPAAAKAVDPLIKVINTDRNRTIRIEAVDALGKIGPDAAKAVDPLIRFLRGTDGYLQMKAAIALGEIGPDAAKAVDPLIENLNSKTDLVKTSAVYALGEIGPSAVKAVDPLINLLENREFTVQSAVALGEIGPGAAKAVDSLIKLLKDPNFSVRTSAAEALGKIGLVAFRSLINILKEASCDSTEHTAELAAEALGAMGPQAVDSLVNILNTANSVRCVRKYAAYALGKMGPGAAKAVDPLIKLLKDPDSGVRTSAAEALGKIGPNAAKALNSLLKLLNDPYTAPYPRLAAETAIISISDNSAKRADKIRLDSLQFIITQFESFLSSFKDQILTQADKDLVSKINSDINSMKYTIDQRKGLIVNKIISLAKQFPVPAAVVLLAIGLLLLWSTLLWLSPLSLLTINNAIRNFSPDIPKVGKVPLRTLTMASLFNYHPRVLDAWVEKYAPEARQRFNRRKTVLDRRVHVSVPTVLDDATIPELKPDNLKPVFANTQSCLLIWGEGGSGKTSLACQIANWASSDDVAQRLKPHRMLPVLIEHELVDGEKGKRLLVAITGQLWSLIDTESTVPDELLEQLLRQGRILVLIDHFSECSEETRAEIRPATPNFFVNTLVITSRIDEPLGHINRHTLKPLRIEGNRLSRFIDVYLVQRNKRDLFSDPEYFDACRQLSLMVMGDRNITVLLAKLFADQMIVVKESSDETDLPKTVPDLMQRYVKELNRGISEARIEDSEVLRCARIVAWECLKQTFLPSSAARTRVLEALNGENGNKKLHYLEERLRLIRSIGEEGDWVRISLDPLAEYLAALHVLRANGANLDNWRKFLQYLDSKSIELKKISGFLLALSDCCQSYKDSLGVPNEICLELNFRASKSGGSD
ncbi:HEAT repeat domain-containing protein [Fibrisoma montanum]|nr:HEAT repeat domain-containing protein [Fibrisoma montanum]